MASCEEEILPIRFTASNVRFTGMGVENFEYTELEVVCIIRSFCCEQINQLAITTMPRAGVGAPATPDSIVARRTANVQLASVPIGDDVDAGHAGKRSLPRFDLLLDYQVQILLREHGSRKTGEFPNS